VVDPASVVRTGPPAIGVNRAPLGGGGPPGAGMLDLSTTTMQAPRRAAPRIGASE